MADQPNPNPNPNQQQQPQAQVSFAPQAHSVLYSDFAQITVNPQMAIIRFGTQVPGRNEFVVHSQIAMPSQALMGFTNALQQHLAQIQNMQQGGGAAPQQGRASTDIIGPEGPIDLTRLN